MSFIERLLSLFLSRYCTRRRRRRQQVLFYIKKSHSRFFTAFKQHSSIFRLSSLSWLFQVEVVKQLIIFTFSSFAEAFFSIDNRRDAWCLQTSFWHWNQWWTLLHSDCKITIDRVVNFATSLEFNKLVKEYFKFLVFWIFKETSGNSRQSKVAEKFHRFLTQCEKKISRNLLHLDISLLTRQRDSPSPHHTMTL